MSKVLGVLGGMGPAATLDFLARLQAATPARRDHDHIRAIADINPRVPDRNTQGPEVASVLAGMAAGLREAGAELLAMPCNTAHAHAAAIEAASGLRLVHMIEAAVAAAAATGARRIGLMATPAAAGLYVRGMEAAGLEAVGLDPGGSEALMAAIQRVKAGERGSAVRSEMTRLAEALEAAGADAVIAGCTEIPLALDAADLHLPLIDAGQVLAELCVALCLDQTRV